MSFIYQDKQLLDMLIRHGQAAPAPAAPTGGPDPAQEKAAIRGLIDRLEQRLSAGPQGAAEITSASGQNVDFNSTHMKNLSQLVNYLGTNKIEINGKPIVVDARENVQDPAYVAFQFEGDQTFRPSTTLQWKVNRALLSQFLNTLRGQLVKNPNPVMQAQVEAMIRESNDQLDTKIGDKYQDPGMTLDPAYVLDKVPQKMLTKTIIYGEGPIPLTFGDVSGDTNFNAWMQNNKIQVDNSQEPDQCGALKFLNARATNKLRNATSVQNKQVATIYQQALAKLAPSFQCDLGGGTQPGAAQKQPGAGGTGAGAQQVATLDQLVEILPLQRDVLDFGRIRDFMNQYRAIAASTTDPNRSQQINTAMDQVEQYMQAATRNTASQSQTTFSMDGLTANDLVEWAVPPGQGQATRSRGSARALADYLEQVVRQVYIVLKDLYNAHYQQFRDPNLANLNVAIQQQVGGPSIPFGSSLASSNIDDIQTARARLPQVGA
jgi:hypothetical protein